jgi:hypothetical protein
MNFSNNKVGDFIMLSPLLGENGPVLMDLWKAQMVWTSLVGLPVVPAKFPDDAPTSLEDLPKP